MSQKAVLEEKNDRGRSPTSSKEDHQQTKATHPSGEPQRRLGNMKEISSNHIKREERADSQIKYDVIY